MSYSQLRHLKPAAFRRYCGLKPETFNRWVDSLTGRLPEVGQRGGQPGFGVEDQLLITLEYWREYRTQFHIATSWGTSESTVCRTIQRVETELAACGYARLPGKKTLKSSEDDELDVVIIDVTESPIERPKKTKALLQRQEKEAYLQCSSLD